MVGGQTGFVLQFSHHQQSGGGVGTGGGAFGLRHVFAAASTLSSGGNSANFPAYLWSAKPKDNDEWPFTASDVVSSIRVPPSIGIFAELMC